MCFSVYKGQRSGSATHQHIVSEAQSTSTCFGSQRSINGSIRACMCFNAEAFLSAAWPDWSVFFFFFSPQSKTSSPLPPTKPASLIVCYFSLFLHLTYIHLFVAQAALEMNPLSLCVCYEKKLGWTDESEEHECPCNTARWRAWRRRTA